MMPRMASERSVVSSAKLIAICTLLSRITGLAREMLLAQSFGLRWVLDAFNYGFQVPNLFRRLFGEGAMAAVFVPTFTQLLERESRAAAWRLLARTLALMCVVLAAITILIELVILGIWQFAPAGVPEVAGPRNLILALTAIMLPFMLSICVVALFSAILNCVGSFVPAALAPIVLNVAMIVGIAWLGPTLAPTDKSGQATVVAWTVLAAGVIQVLTLLPVLRRNGVPLEWRWEPRDPAVRRMLQLLVPVALGQGVLAIGVYLDAQIAVLLTHKAGAPEVIRWLGGVAYPLEEGAWSAVTCAQRLYQFPLGVLVISLATAAMPAFSRMAAREDWGAWAVEVRGSLRLALFEGILTGTMMVVLARPIVRLLFEYNRFGPADTARAGYVLTFYGFAMWAFCAQHIVLRAFYSLHDVKTPLAISATVLPLNLLLTLVLIWVSGIREAAFAISSLVTSGLSVIVGLAFFRRTARVAVVDRQTGVAAAKMLVAAGVAGLAAWACSPHVGDESAGRLLARAVNALVPLAAGTAAFLLSAWLLRVPEVGVLLSLRRRRVAVGA